MNIIAIKTIATVYPIANKIPKRGLIKNAIPQNIAIPIKPAIKGIKELIILITLPPTLFRFYTL